MALGRLGVRLGFRADGFAGKPAPSSRCETSIQEAPGQALGLAPGTALWRR
jgi:hypothetical protein